MFELFILTVIIACFVISGLRLVQQQQVAIVETLGKFTKTMEPGLHWIIPVVQSVRGRVNMRIQEIKANVEVKTKDNMFVHLPVSIQLAPNPANVEDAYYKLQNAEEQIASWILNSVRSIASSMLLEELFSDKEHIVTEVRTVLVSKLRSFGYTIEGVLVDQPTLPDTIQHSFNRVIGAQRDAEAAKQEGEAIRIKAVAQAEAEAQSQRVRAQGMADAREILAKGLAESMLQLEKNNLDADQAVATLVELNRLDVIREAGNKGNVILFDMGNKADLGQREVLGLIAQKNKEKRNTGDNNL